MAGEMQGRRVLVVEDEYLLADDLRTALEEMGAQVLGPVPRADAALALLDRTGPIDAALLDINLGGEQAFPVADVLIARGVPIAFTTGYDRSAIPERFAGIARLEKPVSAKGVAAVLRPLLA